MELICRIALLLSAGLSFAWGCCRSIGKKTALFKSLVFGAMGCLMLGRLYEVITILIEGDIPDSFHIGLYAVMGGFMFLLSSSYGQMDGLVDDRSPELRRYRLIAFVAPLLILCIGLVPLLYPERFAFRIACEIPLVFVCGASYFSLKHLIVPDVSFGIIQSIRKYSLSALCLEFLYAVQLFSESQNLETVWVIVSILIIVNCPLVVLSLEKGVKKWTI